MANHENSRWIVNWWHEWLLFSWMVSIKYQSTWVFCREVQVITLMFHQYLSNFFSTTKVLHARSYIHRELWFLYQKSSMSFTYFTSCSATNLPLCLPFSELDPQPAFASSQSFFCSYPVFFLFPLQVFCALYMLTFKFIISFLQIQFLIQVFLNLSCIYQKTNSIL